MTPLVKYTLARLGLFGVVAAMLLLVPMPVHPLLRLAAAVLISAVVSFWLLRSLRDQVAVELDTAARRRAARREAIRTAPGAATPGPISDPNVSAVSDPNVSRVSDPDVSPVSDPDVSPVSEPNVSPGAADGDVSGSEPDDGRSGS